MDIIVFENFFLKDSEGFIGSYLTEKLVKSGHKVICLVQYNFSNQANQIDLYTEKNFIDTNYNVLKYYQ